MQLNTRNNRGIITKKNLNRMHILRKKQSEIYKKRDRYRERETDRQRESQRGT